MTNIWNLEMEEVAVLMVVAEISRDDDNHALLPVLQDVAHLRKVKKQTCSTSGISTSSPRATQWSRKSGRSAPW